MKRTLPLIIAVLIFSQDVSGQLPVRYWDDDMPQHTFSFGVGPGWASVDDSKAKIGAEAGFRYDWSYFRGYDVSLGTGLTYIFGYRSSDIEGGFAVREGVRFREASHYIGANAINTKMWLGKRAIWDMCIHMGYMGVATHAKTQILKDRMWENGFMGGLSTGFDFLVTAWLGVGVRMNVMTGVLSSSSYSGTVRYTRASLRVGVVYCF